MFEFFWHLGSFILALGILVTVHEYGHFWVARKAGVKVLRFSVGFGKTLVKWHDKQGTEYVIAAIPLGGYVKMLDERVDTVEASQKHLAFNNKPVLSRIAVVSAGPLANFLFAIFVLVIMYSIGVQSLKPVVGHVDEQSIAAEAGVQPGDHIQGVNGQETLTWNEVNFAMLAGLGEEQLSLKVQDANNQIAYRTLDTIQWKLDKRDEPPLTSLGISPFRPEVTSQIAYIESGSPALKAGLEVGDKLLSLDGLAYTSWHNLVKQVQASPNKTMRLEVERNGQLLTLTVITKGRMSDSGFETGYLGVQPVVEKWPDGYIITRQYSLWDSIVLGTKKTWGLITLSFDMIGNFITGQISVDNLSGPVGIAVGAGNSVSGGFIAFLGFLALISVNLGVFNLLPLPVLDGGHLMYYLIELIRGKPVSEKTQEFGFKVGAVLLLSLTFFALFNDISRL